MGNEHGVGAQGPEEKADEELDDGDEFGGTRSWYD